MSSTLVAHEQPVSRIFSNDYVFRIPAYQRPYSWTTQQAGDLLDDIIDFMSSRPGEVENMPPYFLGSIVLIKAENQPQADVVDGQQRLTTLTLLLSAIRANVSGANATDITQLIYERGAQILGTQDRFRLSLRPRDQDFFQQFVQREDGFERLIGLVDVESDSKRNIRDNARLFDARLKAIPEHERIPIAQFVVTRCYLVVVATPDLDSAYRIFSVLNTRGLDLSATDILKAQIVGAIPDARRDSYTSKWEDVEDDLGRTAFGDLFSHIRMIYRKAKPQGTLLAEFKEHVLKDAPPLQFVDDVLIPMANVYEELTDAAFVSTERAEVINASLKWLNKLEFNDWLPPAIAFGIRWRNDPVKMEAFIKDLERLAYSMLLTRKGINERIDRFSRLTKAIETNGDLFAPSSPLQLTAMDQYTTFNVLAGPIYESLSARARSLVLLRLDSLLSAGGAVYDYETVTVEHVLPQSPPAGSEWLAWFPNSDVRLAIVHTLGNLALLTRKKNSAASNYDFERKKNTYFSRGGISPFVLTTQVLRHSTWTPEIVAARQIELLDIFEAHWRLEGRKDPTIQIEANKAYEGDGSWREDVREGLRRLGGRASLYNLYREVEEIRRANGRSLPAALEAVTRRTLEENSSDCESYRGGPNVFCVPEGKGAGVWALREEQ